MLLQYKTKQLGVQLEQIIFIVVDLLKSLVYQLFEAFFLNILELKFSGEVKQIEKPILFKIDDHISLQLLVQHLYPQKWQNI